MRYRIVMIRSRALDDSRQPVYHEYRRAGETACGRGFYIVPPADPGEERMEFVNRRHADRFARQCKKCAAALQEETPKGTP